MTRQAHDALEIRLRVFFSLTARDEGGNEGRSEPFAFRLPERAFTNRWRRRWSSSGAISRSTPASVLRSSLRSMR
jgi:hypothetical protein